MLQVLRPRPQGPATGAAHATRWTTRCAQPPPPCSCPNLLFGCANAGSNGSCYSCSSSRQGCWLAVAASNDDCVKIPDSSRYKAGGCFRDKCASLSTAAAAHVRVGFFDKDADRIGQVSCCFQAALTVTVYPRPGCWPTFHVAEQRGEVVGRTNARLSSIHPSHPSLHPASPRCWDSDSCLIVCLLATSRICIYASVRHESENEA